MAIQDDYIGRSSTDLLQSERDFLRSVSLVSRMFCDIAQPLLFRDVGIRTNNWCRGCLSETLPTVCESSMTLDASMDLLDYLECLSSSRISPMVRHMVVDFSRYHSYKGRRYAEPAEDDCIPTSVVADTILYRLPSFINLQMLDLQSVPLTPARIEWILPLRNLSAFRAFQCPPPTEDSDISAVKPSFHLTELVIQERDMEGWARLERFPTASKPWWTPLVCKQTTSQLQISTRNTAAEVAYLSSLVVTANSSGESFCSVRSLIISEDFTQYQDALKVLSYLPSLEVLHLLPRDIEDPVGIDIVPKDAVPNLQEISGKWRFIQAFLPHHLHLRTLVFTTRIECELAMEILNFIAIRRPDIANINMKCHNLSNMDIIQLLLTKFPTLKTFHLDSMPLDGFHEGLRSVRLRSY